jgi:glycosyltransferase involved in cell wall biosynthesis
MIREPLISIVTASLNSGATIRNTLESVRTQRKVNLEHIVCDGGSTDGTLAVLEEFKSSYNLRWISKPDNGIADALNRGLSHSRGKYVIVIQADDYLTSPTVLFQVKDVLKSERYDICSFPVVFKHPELGARLFLPKKQLWWNHFKAIFPHQGCFVKKTLYKEVGGYRDAFSLAVDYDFFYRALQFKPKVLFGSEAVAVMGGSGISSSENNLAQRLAEEKLVQKMNENKLIWKIMQYIFRSLYTPYKLRFSRKFRVAYFRG